MEILLTIAGLILVICFCYLMLCYRQYLQEKLFKKLLKEILAPLEKANRDFKQWKPF